MMTIYGMLCNDIYDEYMFIHEINIVSTVSGTVLLFFKWVWCFPLSALEVFYNPFLHCTTL